MFAGHFGLAAAVKAVEPKVPLWALMVSTQLLDIAFVPLLLTGVETLEPIGDGGYGANIIHADYTHSLVGALLLSLIAGFIAWRVWDRRSAVVIGSLSFSHWLLDLVVHRSDMPILPGNYGDFPLLGLRLWELPAVSAAAEIVLVLCGAVLYFIAVMKRSRGQASPSNRVNPGVSSLKQAYLAGTLMSVLLVLSFVSDYFGIG
ncbi:permease [Paenibacillus harenae]|uniref:permease n=1 Tax=Paenibacillus harenae TaxID=306543 RepID=UPI000402EFC0|nr:permease [Paenibacillus harenae]